MEKEKNITEEALKKIGINDEMIVKFPISKEGKEAIKKHIYGETKKDS